MPKGRAMPARVRLVLAGAIAATTLIVLGAAFAPTDDAEPEAGYGKRSPFRGSAMPAGVRAPEFVLRDEQGRRLDSRSLRGRPLVVAFLYSTCKDTCPLEAQQVRGALDKIGDDDKVTALAVSVDPGNDTPASARKFLVEQRVYGRMQFALGTKDQLKPVWRGFFIQEQTDESEHQARVTLVDGNGLQRVGYPIDALTPENLAADIRTLLAER